MTIFRAFTAQIVNRRSLFYLFLDPINPVNPVKKEGTADESNLERRDYRRK